MVKLRDVELGRIGTETVVGCLKNYVLKYFWKVRGEKRQTTRKRAGVPFHI
jgi:hypothetical protein